MKLISPPTILDTCLRFPNWKDKHVLWWLWWHTCEVAKICLDRCLRRMGRMAHMAWKWTQSPKRGCFETVAGVWVLSVEAGLTWRYGPVALVSYNECNLKRSISINRANISQHLLRTLDPHRLEILFLCFLLFCFFWCLSMFCEIVFFLRAWAIKCRKHRYWFTVFCAHAHSKITSPWSPALNNKKNTKFGQHSKCYAIFVGVSYGFLDLLHQNHPRSQAFPVQGSEELGAKSLSHGWSKASGAVSRCARSFCSSAAMKERPSWLTSSQLRALGTDHGESPMYPLVNIQKAIEKGHL